MRDLTNDARLVVMGSDMLGSYYELPWYSM